MNQFGVSKRAASPIVLGRAKGAVLTVVALGLVSLSSAVAALDTTARELLDEAVRKNGTTTWRDRKLDLTIESRSGDSVARSRTAEVEERRAADGTQRTFIAFTGPSDVEGTLYLHLKPHGEEEQEWIYAPAARRPRRLTPGQSDEVSTGAELGYREVERVTQVLALSDGDAEATLQPDATIDGRPTRVVRLTPRSPRPGDATTYDIWLFADDLLVHKILPSGGSGAPKEIVLGDYATIDGHATPALIDVTGPDGAWRTVFKLSDVHYDVGLADGSFSLARLTRGR
jgi:hypothetical protein